MTRDTGRRHRGASAAASDAKGCRYACSPTVEPLEDRQLLSQGFSGLSANRPVQAPGGMFMLSISGPGLERVTQLGHGQIGVTLLGTTDASTLTVSLTHPRFHKASVPLQIGSIKVNSGQLGGIAAPVATLTGAITPFLGSVNSLQFGALGPNAQIDVGSVGSLSVSGAVTLGASGHVSIAGDVTSGLSLGALALDGGRFVVGHDVDGGLNLGAVDLSQGGQFLIGHDVTGASQISGDLAVNTNSFFLIGHDLTGGLSVAQDVDLDSKGQLAIGNDVTGLVHVAGNLNISNGARLIVNRDLTGGVSVDGDLALSSGDAFAVGRTLSALTVRGDLLVSPTGSGITVGGDLTNLTVDGAFVGQGSKTAIDLSVGLNLGQLTVLGGGAGLGGIQDANINVAKSILGLNVAHGIFNSIITAGVSINGGTNGASGVANIGADGTDAILNSQLLAGESIVNMLIGGDVVSTFAVNPNSTGYPTRIIAGVTRAGVYSSGGLIDNFQITGSLNDSVLAASVAPFGGNGTLPVNGYGSPPPMPSPTPGDGGFNTYDAPAGTITGGTVGNPIKFPNWTELDYFNETLTGVSYNTAIDPTIDDFIFPGGSINPSFASPPLSQATLSGSTTVTTNQGTTINGSSTTTTVSPSDQPLPLPTKSTVLGGVISTTHGDSADFAGLFAADTSGVFVGAIPAAT